MQTRDARKMYENIKCGWNEMLKGEDEKMGIIMGKACRLKGNI